MEWFLDSSERTLCKRLTKNVFLHRKGLTYKKKQDYLCNRCVWLYYPLNEANSCYKSKKNFKGDVIFYITLETACLYTNPRVGARGYKGSAQVP